MAISKVMGRPVEAPAGAGGQGVHGFWKCGQRRASKNYFFQLIDFPCAPTRTSIRTFVDRTQRTFPATCENSKDYLHCVLSLEEATIPRNGTINGPSIVTRRNAPSNAQALAGSCAFVCVPQAGMARQHRESEDRHYPGGSRV